MNTQNIAIYGGNIPEIIVDSIVIRVFTDPDQTNNSVDYIYLIEFRMITNVSSYTDANY